MPDLGPKAYRWTSERKPQTFQEPKTIRFVVSVRFLGSVFVFGLRGSGSFEAVRQFADRFLRFLQ